MTETRRTPPATTGPGLGASEEPTGPLAAYLDGRFGDDRPLSVRPLVGGGSCEVFAVDRGAERWVLRRAPRHASSATAHDVLREFRILDAVKDEDVRIARPILSCADPTVFGAPFYLMTRIDGVPVRTHVPPGWAAAPESHGRALEELVDALAEVHGVDWRACGLGHLDHGGPQGDEGGFLARQIARWLAQLDSYGGRDLPVAHDVAAWLETHRPAGRPRALCHGDYKLDNVLFAPAAPPRLLAVVDWEMAAIGDPLVDLAWALIFHPGPDGTTHLGMGQEPTFAVTHLPGRDELAARYAAATGRDVGSLPWYDVFARWKLAVVLEGSYAKFLRGLSDKPVHQYFGHQVDMLLASAAAMLEHEAA